MNISKTIQVICKAWADAEKKMIQEVSEYQPGLDEVCITNQFFALLQKELKEASKTGLIQAAFYEDLMEAFPDIPRHHRAESQHVLIAEALHNQYVEGHKTGADFGLIVSRPEVKRYAGVSPRYLPFLPSAGVSFVRVQRVIQRVKPYYWLVHVLFSVGIRPR